jgi:hypothetical protein
VDSNVLFGKKCQDIVAIIAWNKLLVSSSSTNALTPGII